jgi:H+/Cl- antiporter ClcA
MAQSSGQPMTTKPDPAALLRSSSYLRLLAVAALLGAPVSAIAYGFLALISYLQKELFTVLPSGLGFAAEPAWWPLPVLLTGGVLAALAIRYLPGGGGPSPAGRFELHGAPAPDALPGIVLAALATLCFGLVLGPEAPLIAVGSGLAALSVRLARRPVPDQASAVVASAGSFAAISTLLGSPILGAFLLMEASGLGGAMLGLVLVPGLLAAGIGSLIFLGLDSLTGLGTFSLAIPGLPPFHPARCSRIRLGHRHRPRRRTGGRGHPPAEPASAGLREPADDADAARRRAGRRGTGHRLCRGHRQAEF